MDKKKSLNIYGLLGYPVKHSFSPAMHNAGFKALSINAEYKLFPTEFKDLKSFLSSLRDNNIKGLNVTVPYKERVLAYMDSLSPEARFCGAVNVVTVSKDELKGWNTDGLGFVKHLTGELGFRIKGKRVVLLGAGGAAKAVAEQLASNKANNIQICDLDKTKGIELTDKINREFYSFDNGKAEFISRVEDLDIRKADLLINATPVGLDPCQDILISPEKLHKGLFVYDLIYNPAETKLLRSASQKGAATSNGLGMLFYQGVRSFEIWLGLNEGQAPQEEMKKALFDQIKQ